jgi:hypothetical protein
MRENVAIALLLPCALLAIGTRKSEFCTSSPPAYADVIEALGRLGPRLDSIPLIGTRNITVVVRNDQTELVEVGIASQNTIASSSASCRVGLLWTSRGDSLAVHWLVDPGFFSLSDTTPTVSPDDILAVPRVLSHPTRGYVRSRALADSLIAARAEAAGAEIGVGATNVWVLIGPDGRLMNARIARSSLVRGLDEQALTIPGQLDYEPARLQSGEPVPAWYLMPIIWRR